MWIKNIKNTRIIQTITIILAFCSIIYELVFSQILSIVFGSSVLMYSLTIGIFLFSMGLGSIFYEKIKKKKKENLFLKIELLLSLVGIIGIPFILWINSFELNYYLAILLSFIPVILIGLLSGFEIPVLLDLDKKNSFSKILGVDYFGSLLGTVLYSLYLYPNFGLFTTILIITSINIFTTLFYLKSKNKIKFYWILIPLLIYTTLFLNATSINTYFEKKYWGNKITEFYNQYTNKDSKLIVDIDNIERTKYQTIIQYKIRTEMINPKTNKPFWSDYCLNLDTHLQLCDSWYEAYNLGLIDVPFSFFEKEKKIDILLLGGGDYIPANGLKKFDNRIKSIDMVDLDPDFRKFAKKKLIKYNQKAWNYKKIKLHSEDAFTFLKKNKKKYDLILFDLPGAKSEKMLPLYSIEMFKFIHSALKKDGVFIKWTYDDKFYQAHYRISNNNLYLASFKWKKEYRIYNPKTKRYSEYFSILTNQKKDFINPTEYLKRYGKKIIFKDSKVIKYKEYGTSSVFKPNYYLMVKNKM